MTTHWTDPSILIAIVLAGITAVYTFVTAMIWHATWQNTKATRELLEASHRPYIGVNGARLASHGFGHAAVIVSYANIGSVPSRNVRIDLDLCAGGKRRTTLGNPIAAFPGQSFEATLPLVREEMAYPNAAFDIEVTVHYQGMTEKCYTTHCTCSFAGAEKGFSISAGNFD